MYDSVLLIDDSEIDNFIHEKVIMSNQFAKRVYVNTGALAALEFLHNLSLIGKEFASIIPRVIFIDINMPGMSGFDFIEHFKSRGDDYLLKPKLVILTSSVSREDKLLAMEAGEDIIFLNKPLTAEHLKEI